jgi:hypothetical protein
LLPKTDIINRSKIFFSNDQTEIYLNENQFIKDKKIISISPGGYKGFYLMGVVTYIKENYPITPFIFSGASAGAWNSLLMTYKGDPMEIVNNVIDNTSKKAKTINELEYILKYKFLNAYKDTDFELERLFIGVTSLNNFKINTNIYSDFDDLEDAIDCCIASSHIPFITGGLTNKYHNVYTFDGGFSSYPYLRTAKPVLHISPSMWKPANDNVFEITTLFSKEKYDFLELFKEGYNDSKENKKALDAIFLMQ